MRKTSENQIYQYHDDIFMILTSEREHETIFKDFLNEIECEIEEFYSGKMDQNCLNCNSFHFLEEVNRSGVHKSCCHFGHENLENSVDFLEQLKTLLKGETKNSKVFLKNIG